MRDSINGHAIFNSNQMARQIDRRPVVLVESDADLSIMGPHLISESVRPTPGFSKTAVLLAAELHRNNGDDWVVAVVDRDLARISEANVVSTSHYDLEAEIYFKALGKVERYVYSYIVSETIPHNTAQQKSRETVEEAEKIALAIGCLRKSSHEGNVGISMSSLPVSEIVRRDSDGTYLEAAAEMACLKASAHEHKDGLIDAARHAISRTTDDVRVLCCGHDLLQALCELIGECTGRRPAAREFARGLHASLTCAEFAALSIYRPLEDWLHRLCRQELWDCAA